MDYIFCKTDFDKSSYPNTPNFVYGALESKRRIDVSPTISPEQITNLIQKHYSNCEGNECSIWGKVQEYHHITESLCNVYDIDGTFITSD